MPTDASDFRYIPNHNHHLLTNKHRSYESIKTTGSISSSGIGRGITALSAQNREVSGKVLDANQQPLVGVAVLVDGTTKGVTTSENGTFKIQVPSGEAVLQVTCLGYLPQKVTVPSSRNSITIYLQEDAIMLDATVVIGYGTQKKST